jgi:hypothetical protein
MAVPDVIGLPLDDARDRLRAAGIDIREVSETRPPALSGRPRAEGPPAGDAPPRPRKQGGGLRVLELAGDLRVVRVRGEGPVDLVVTRERYVAQPRSS